MDAITLAKMGEQIKASGFKATITSEGPLKPLLPVEYDSLEVIHRSMAIMRGLMFPISEIMVNPKDYRGIRSRLKSRSMLRRLIH